MAGNQDGFLSDIDLSALAQVWSMLNPEARLQQEMGQDAPNVRGGLGVVEDAATGPVAGVQGLRSLLRLLLRGKGAEHRVDRSMKDAIRQTQKKNLPPSTYRADSEAMHRELRERHLMKEAQRARNRRMAIQRLLRRQR